MPAELIPVLRPRLPSAEKLLPYLRRIDETRLYSNHGPLSVELERRLAQLLRLPAGGVVCAGSGTAALVGGILASAGRGTPERPLAIIPAFTFVATAIAVEQCGYRPYLADINANNWMLDAEKLVEHPELDRVGLVVPVATFGRPMTQEPWRRFCAATGIPVVIDGAASFTGLAADPDRLLGEIPVTISFHATKAFATGEGGAVAIRDIEVALRVGQALNFGIHEIRECRMPSINGKMSEYHAAVGLAELDGWTEKLTAWRHIAECYRSHFMKAGLAERFYGAPDIGPNYALFRCRDSAEAERVRNALNRERIDFRLWYGSGVHNHTYYRGISRDRLRTTEKVAACLLGLPTAPDLSEAAVMKVVEILAAAGKSSEPM